VPLKKSFLVSCWSQRCANQYGNGLWATLNEKKVLGRYSLEQSG
jgi:hypothetical protein